MTLWRLKEYEQQVSWGIFVDPMLKNDLGNFVCVLFA